MATYAYTFTSGDTVTPTKLNNARTVSEIVNADVSASAAIAGTKMADDSIANAKIKSDAAIAGTKISPNFGDQNVFTTGQAAVGTAINANVKLNVGGTMPAQTTQRALAVGPAFDQNATVGAQVVITGPATAANGGIGYTLPGLTHFLANQGTLHADSTVTNQYGLFVSASLIGATNNYGVFSQIPSGTNRWNIYVSGTANNYFAGNVGIGTASPTEKLSITGNVTASGTVTATAFAGPITGQVTAPNGTAASPGVKLTSAATGIFGTTTLGLSANGIHAATVLPPNTGTNGSGIQLQTPAATDYAGIYNSASNSYTYISGSSGPANGGQIRVYGSTHATKPSFVELTNGNTVRMTVDNNGLVGIGTTAPATALQVNGTVRATDYEVSTNKVVGARVTGWGAPTGTISRSALTVTASATYSQSEMNTVIQSLKAVITDLRTHGLIGN